MQDRGGYPSEIGKLFVDSLESHEVCVDVMRVEKVVGIEVARRRRLLLLLWLVVGGDETLLMAAGRL